MNTKQLVKDGYEISYNTYGDISKECIIFLHPAFSDNTIFYKQVDFFSQEYFVITMDLMGHGLSCINKTNKQLDETSNHILEILKIEGIETAHLVGVSLGSLIIQHFAYCNPNKTKTLTIVGGYNIHKDNSKILKAQNKEQLKWIFMIIFAMNKFKKFISNGLVINDNEREIVHKSTKGFTRSAFRVMQGVSKLFIQSDKLSEIPILLICGDNDLEISKDALKTWYETEPNSEFNIIKNAGHCANMDNSKDFNRIVLNFIEKHI